MKKLFYVILVLVFVVCLPQLLSAENRRHFIILQDNSGSYWEKKNLSKIKAVQDSIIALFNNEHEGDGYDLLRKEQSQNILFFDPKNDEISFLWFVADQEGNVQFKNNTNGEYQKFEEYFFTPGTKPQFSNSGYNQEAFLNENFSNRPKLKSMPHYNGELDVYSFTSMAYPLCLDVVKTDYSQEYIILIISDFKTGSTFGNKKDESLFESAFGSAFKEKEDGVLSRVAFLKGQFVALDFCEDYIGDICYYAFKIIPNAGYPKPENIDVRINSNIVFDQVSYDDDHYSLRESEVVFQHSEDLSIDEIGVEISLSGNKRVYKDITSFTQEKNGRFKISSIQGIELPNVRNDSSFFPSEIRFIFKGGYHLDGEGGTSLKYVFDTTQSLNQSNFNLKTKKSSTKMVSFISIALLCVGAIVALVFIHKGKPLGIKIRFNRLNDSYETIDFSPEGSGKVHTDYKYWSHEDDQNGFEIKVEGRFDYLSLNKWYNWKEKVGNRVFVSPRIKHVPDNFSIVVSKGAKASNQENQPIEIDEFNNGVFSFTFRFQKLTDETIKEPIKIEIGAILTSVYNGLFRHFELDKEMKYVFHIGPDLGNVWLGVDPGTTGSCIAVGTSTADLTIEKVDGKDKITPSVILINPNELEDDPEESVREELVRKNVIFGDRANAYLGGQDKKLIKNMFLSIKKLLGYNEEFEILGKEIPGKKDEHIKLKVKSSWLSTLLIEGLLKQQKEFISKHSQQFPQFLYNGQFAPQRAVFAIPNNFTAAKMQQLKDCISHVKNLTIKEVRFIYEAEAILVNYLNSPKAKTTKLDSPSGETVFIFDMGGATINATLANVKLHKEKNNWKYVVKIISKLGYAIGGDTIDYAYLKWIFSKKDSYPDLVKIDPFVKDKDMMAERRTLKGQIENLKKSTVARYNSNKSLLIDREQLANIFGINLPMGNRDDLPVDKIELELENEKDPFLKDIQNNKTSFLYSTYFDDYVWKNIKNIVDDTVKICSNKSVPFIDTVIMSGRSSHFPRVREIVEKSIKEKLNPDCNPKDSIIQLELEESKSAVAKGACYYGILNNHITLNEMMTNGAFGVVQRIAPNPAPPQFIQLIDVGEPFKIVDGESQERKVVGEQNIEKMRDFDCDGKMVNFCQVMGVDPQAIVSNNEKHKYIKIASIEAKPFDVQSVGISVSDHDKIQCKVTDVQEASRIVEAVVCDKDITTFNDQHYTFFVKQS